MSGSASDGVMQGPLIEDEVLVRADGGGDCGVGGPIASDCVQAFAVNP